MFKLVQFLSCEIFLGFMLLLVVFGILAIVKYFQSLLALVDKQNQKYNFVSIDFWLKYQNNVVIANVICSRLLYVILEFLTVTYKFQSMEYIQKKSII